MSISTADGIHCENSSCKTFFCISHSMFSLKHGSLNELEQNFLFVLAKYFSFRLVKFLSYFIHRTTNFVWRSVDFFVFPR